MRMPWPVDFSAPSAGGAAGPVTCARAGRLHKVHATKVKAKSAEHRRPTDWRIALMVPLLNSSSPGGCCGAGPSTEPFYAYKSCGASGSYGIEYADFAVGVQQAEGDRVSITP